MAANSFRIKLPFGSRWEKSSKVCPSSSLMGISSCHILNLLIASQMTQFIFWIIVQGAVIFIVPFEFLTIFWFSNVLGSIHRCATASQVNQAYSLNHSGLIGFMITSGTGDMEASISVNDCISSSGLIGVISEILEISRALAWSFPTCFTPVAISHRIESIFLSMISCSGLILFGLNPAGCSLASSCQFLNPCFFAMAERVSFGCTV